MVSSEGACAAYYRYRLRKSKRPDLYRRERRELRAGSSAVPGVPVPPMPLGKCRGLDCSSPDRAIPDQESRASSLPTICRDAAQNGAAILPRWRTKSDARLADPRQLLAAQAVEDALHAHRAAQRDLAPRRRPHLADPAGAARRREALHDRQRAAPPARPARRR